MVSREALARAAEHGGFKLAARVAAIASAVAASAAVAVLGWFGGEVIDLKERMRAAEVAMTHGLAPRLARAEQDVQGGRQALLLLRGEVGAAWAGRFSRGDAERLEARLATRLDRLQGQLDALRAHLVLLLPAPDHTEERP